MKILSKNHSSYPRVGDQYDQQKLRRAYNKYDKKKISLDELNSILDETVAEAVTEQLKSGCDFVTDGTIRSYDPVSHIAGKINGFQINGLLRFFDTNFYYRQPVAVSLPQYERPLASDEFEFVSNIASDKASAVLVGPYSLLKMSIIDGPLENYLPKMAEIYADEMKKLKGVGARLVQLEEPAILQNQDDFDLFKTTYDLMTTNASAPETLIALNFGDASGIVDKLAQLPVDGICFDFTYSPGLESRLGDFPMNIGLGIVDGRNTKMENLDDTVKLAERVINKISAEKVYITSSCGLEFLPRGRAYDKLKLCADIVRALRGGSK